MTGSEAKQTAIIPSINLAPRDKTSTKTRRHSVSDTKDYFSKSVKNLAGIGDKKPGISRTHSTGEMYVKDPQASPRVRECVGSFFEDYYKKHPLSRMDAKQLAENPEMDL